MVVPGCPPPAATLVFSWAAASKLLVVTAVPLSTVVLVMTVRLPSGSYWSASVLPSG